MDSSRAMVQVGNHEDESQLQPLSPKGPTPAEPVAGKESPWLSYVVAAFALAAVNAVLVLVVKPEFHNPDDVDQVLTWQPYVVLNAVAMAIGLMAIGLPADLLLLGLSSSFCVMNIITTKELLEGLANSGVVAVATLCAVSAAIDKTKALKKIMGNCLGSPSSTSVAMLRMAIPLCTMGTVFNNTPLVAVMIPIVNDWTKQAGLSVGYFMMPLSFITMLSACITTMGSSTNLLAVDLVPEADIHFLDLAPVGIFIMITGVTYCCFLAPYLLPASDDGAVPEAATKSAEVSEVNPETALDRYAVFCKVKQGGPFDGRSAESSQILRALPAPAWMRGIDDCTDKPTLQANDMLEAINVTADDVATLVALPGLDLQQAGANYRTDMHKLSRRRSLTMESPAEASFGMPVRKWVAASMSGGWKPQKRCLYEVVVAPGGLMKKGRNSILGTVGIAELQKNLSEWDCTLVAVQGAHEGVDEQMKLQGGEILLVEVLDPVTFQACCKDAFRKLIPIGEGTSPIQVMVSPLDPLRPGLAVLGLALCVGLSALNICPLDATAILVGLSSILIGTLSNKDLYGAINGPVLLTVAGSFGVGSAFAKTGVASLLARSVLSLVENSGPCAVLGAVVGLALCLGVIVSNNTTVILLAPMVKDICERQDMSVKMVMIAVIYAANLSFATPFSYQTNMMVMPHGHYVFMDYVKFGVPMMLICGVVALVGSFMYWG